MTKELTSEIPEGRELVEDAGVGETIEIKVVADSTAYGTRITTLEARYPPEWDHALMKCRMFSRTRLKTRSNNLLRLLITSTWWDQWIDKSKGSLPQSTIARALDRSEARELDDGAWHVPYYNKGQWQDAGDGIDREGNTLEHAQAISAISIQHGTGTKVVDQAVLYKDMRKRADESYFEHQATPMGLRAINMTDDFDIIFDEGVTHLDNKGKVWSGNYRDWVQLRKMKSFYEYEEDAAEVGE